MLHRFTLKHNGRDSRWDLKDQTGEVIRTFQRKSDATASGVLEAAVGEKGGTVRIHKRDGILEEERTFPRSRDPRDSPG
jgi:hypothetical protein